MRSVLLSFFLLTACLPPEPSTSEPTTSPNATKIVTYEVPDIEVERVETMLRLLLRDEGSVTAGPPGRVVVAAPASLHEGVAELVAQTAESTSAGVPDLDFRYWLLVGTPAQEGAEDLPSVPERLAPVAREITEQHGPTTFKVLESRRLISRSGDTAESDSTVLRIRQKAAISGDGSTIVAELRLRTFKPREVFNQFTGKPLSAGTTGKDDIETTLRIEPGQLVVLAERSGEDGRRLFYVVQGVVVGS